MKKIGVSLVILLFLVTAAGADTYFFGNLVGTGEYQGSLAIDGSGNIALSIIAVTDGSVGSSTFSADDTGGAQAGQSSSATGTGVFAGSGAVNPDGETAATGDMTIGTGATVTTSQGAHADGSAGAGQSSVVTGSEALVGSKAKNDEGEVASTYDKAIGDASITTHQGAHTGNSVSAGQTSTVQGNEALANSSASNGMGETATTSDAVQKGVIRTEQGAHANGYSAGAGQDSCLRGMIAEASSSASSTEGYAAETMDFVVDGFIKTDQGAHADGYSAGAGQDSVIMGVLGTAGSSAWNDAGDMAGTSDLVAGLLKKGFIITDQGAHTSEYSTGSGQNSYLRGDFGTTSTYASDAENNSVNTGNWVVMGSICTDQDADTGFSVHAGQHSTVKGIMASASTGASNDAGDTAGTSDTVMNGIIRTGQGGYADISSTGTGQGSTLRGSTAIAKSNATSSAGDDAGTSVEVQDGIIRTHQGADTGNSAGAGQDSYVRGTNGSASTYAGQTGASGTVYTETGASFAGKGRLTTWQSAETGDAFASIFDHDILAEDGAYVVQFSSLRSCDGGEAYSRGMNDGRIASTVASYAGKGSIHNTMQGAAAGTVVVNEEPFLDGAIAAQYTAKIHSDDGGTVRSWGWNGDDGDFAITSAGFADEGSIEGTFQAASAGNASLFHLGIEAEGAAAGQHTDLITSTDHGVAWSWANNERENRAGTVAEFDGLGEIKKTTQGSVAGSGTAPFISEIEGAAAGQLTGFIGSLDGGRAKSWANNDGENFAQSNSTYTGPGLISELMQGAAAGEVDGTEGAIAGQKTNVAGLTALAGTSADAYDGMHSETSASALIGSVTASQAAAATGEAWTIQDIQVTGVSGNAASRAWSDTGNYAGVDAGFAGLSGSVSATQMAGTDVIVPGNTTAIQDATIDVLLGSACANAYAGNGSFREVYVKDQTGFMLSGNLHASSVAWGDDLVSYASESVTASSRRNHMDAYAENLLTSKADDKTGKTLTGTAWATAIEVYAEVP